MRSKSRGSTYNRRIIVHLAHELAQSNVLLRWDPRFYRWDLCGRIVCTVQVHAWRGGRSLVGLVCVASGFQVCFKFCFEFVFDLFIFSMGVPVARVEELFIFCHLVRFDRMDVVAQVVLNANRCGGLDAGGRFRDVTNVRLDVEDSASLSSQPVVICNENMNRMSLDIYGWTP